MASTFSAIEAYGAGPTVVDPTTRWNLGSADGPSGSDITTWPNANPVTIPGAGTAYSYERWIRGKWTTVGTSITSVTFCHHLVSLPSGITLYGGPKSNTSYVQAVNTVSSYATTNISTADTTFSDGGSYGSGTVSSNYNVLQLRVASTCTTPGNLGDISIRCGWNEI